MANDFWNIKQEVKNKQKSFIETMENIEEETVDFLWMNRIPRGRLTLFDGDPGIGKSYTALAIAAALSRGEALPYDREPEMPTRSFIISAEDGPADTIKPRLRKLKADMSMIAVPNREMNLAPSSINAALLGNVVREFNPALIILDPIIAFAARKNMDKAGDVREILQPLAALAGQCNIAIVLIRHLNKGMAQSKALYRGQGSIDFAAVCRSIFIFAQDNDNPARRLMAHAKNSLGPIQSTLEFYLDDEGFFRWGDQTSESADEVLMPKETGKKREATELNFAIEFLETALSNGPQSSSVLKQKASQRGIKSATMWRAKAELEVLASKDRSTGDWFWRLP